MSTAQTRKKLPYDPEAIEQSFIGEYLPKYHKRYGARSVFLKNSIAPKTDLEKALFMAGGIDPKETINGLGDHLPLWMSYAIGGVRGRKFHGVLLHLKAQEKQWQESHQASMSPAEYHEVLSNSGTGDYKLNLSLVVLHSFTDTPKTTNKFGIRIPNDFDVKLFLRWMAHLSKELDSVAEATDSLRSPTEMLALHHKVNDMDLKEIFMTLMGTWYSTEKAAEGPMGDLTSKRSYAGGWAKRGVDLKTLEGLKEQAKRDCANPSGGGEAIPLDWWLEMNGSRVFKDNEYLKGL